MFLPLLLNYFFPFILSLYFLSFYIFFLHISSLFMRRPPLCFSASRGATPPVAALSGLQRSPCPQAPAQPRRPPLPYWAPAPLPRPTFRAAAPLHGLPNPATPAVARPHALLRRRTVLQPAAPPVVRPPAAWPPAQEHSRSRPRPPPREERNERRGHGGKYGSGMRASAWSGMEP